VIQSLRVRNLALLEELELEFGKGLHVVTGETGAGKSILLGAIALLCGRRVSSEVVRSGEREARVEALFDAGELLARARELGLAEDDESELLVARSVSREGRGKVWVNGRLATVEMLARLMDGAVEVASQGEHQRLLRPELQTELLDAQGGLAELRAAVAAGFERWRGLAEQIAERSERAAELARREDQLRAELEQIERAELDPAELEELEVEHARLAHVERLGERSSAALARLDDGDAGARSQLRDARAQLRDVLALDPALREVDAALERAELECADAAFALERYSSSLEAEPGRLEHVERRLGEIRRLQARFGASVEAILAYAEQARGELERLGGGVERDAALRAELERASHELERAAARLSERRRTAAGELGAAVGRELAGVDLGKARFEVRIEAVAPPERAGLIAPSGPGGCERASFYLAANPGEEARRLRDAASGGELARLLLALRNAMRGADVGRLLLFDEVDAGIGGATATRVGGRLRQLAEVHDILCITHLPQIAALGHAHYRVHKREQQGRTVTRVERLEDEARVDEIARMAGGGKITAVARAHARELLSS
jgi:DNA repair protein RecN (Recombination protein N)